MPGRLDISKWMLRAEETAGQTPHAWYERPGDDRFWLFKINEDEDRPFGEDMAEVVASRLAQRLGVPAARVELAVQHGAPGCIVRDLRPTKWSYEAGSELLAGADPDYQPPQGNSIPSIIRALEKVGPPPNSAPVIKSGAGAFAGMLLLDALVANTDRHENNWHVLTPPPGQESFPRLCGAFDHGSALGFNETDRKKKEILDRGIMERWANGGKARQFARNSAGKVRTLVELAALLLASLRDYEASHWIIQLEALTDEGIASTASVLKGLTTATSHKFATELVSVNRVRLLSMIGGI